MASEPGRVDRGGLALIPAIAVGGLVTPNTLPELAGVIYFGIVGTFAFGLMIVAMRGVTATESSIVILLEPLTAGFIGVAFFAEQLAATAIFGAVLMLGSVVALFRGNTRRSTSGMDSDKTPVEHGENIVARGAGT